MSAGKLGWRERGDSLYPEALRLDSSPLTSPSWAGSVQTYKRPDGGKWCNHSTIDIQIESELNCLLVSIFSRQTYDQPFALLELLDHCYRIEEDELAKIFSERFGVLITNALHEFLRPPEKIGVGDPLVLFGNPLKSLPARIIFNQAPVTVSADESCCVYKYCSAVQRFELQFSGAPKEISRWAATLKNGPFVAAPLFLYFFNRFRAANALLKEAEDERQLMRGVFQELRTATSPSVALARITESAGFDWLVLSLYGLTTDMLVPIACSDGTLLPRLELLRVCNLSSFELLRKTPQALVKEDLALLQNKPCNCALFASLGAIEAVHVRFGRDAFNEVEPRGVLSFYRKDKLAITPKDQIRIDLASREIAAWIDELDEKVEHQIARETISATEKRSGEAAAGTFDESVLAAIATKLGQIIDAAVSGFIHVQSVAGPFRCGFLLNGKAIGEMPTFALTADNLRRNEDDNNREVYCSDSQAAIVIPSLNSNGLAIALWSPAERLTLLRSHVFDWLYELMSLVYHLLRIERKRLAWTHRLVHDVSQPLQGLLLMGSEVRRLAGTVTVPRRDIENYAEDMETSILRIKALLLRFRAFTGSEQQPRLRPIQIEGDVLRPNRRLLSAYAAKRKLSISSSYGYELIPAINSDPDYLSIIFYNLLDNAIKYSNRHTQILVICGEDADDYFVEVTNEGKAIRPEETSKIFQEGYRGIEVRDREVGLGMGLSIAQKIASMLGCRLELEDPVGTNPKITFRVLIPKALKI